MFAFRRDLRDLGAILMPFARAIQCLEAKDTTPADVYIYWLAVVAQLADLFQKDSIKPSPRYPGTLRDSIRQIANSRFSQLIENKQASNVYLAAFILDPGMYRYTPYLRDIVNGVTENRTAPILSNPNPLRLPPLTLAQREDGTRFVKPNSNSNQVQNIGLSLLQILQHEYGDEYRPGRTINEAKAAMQTINPYLADYTPKDAVNALKTQLQAYIEGLEPFNRIRRKGDTLRAYWQRFLDTKEEGALVLAVSTHKLRLRFREHSPQ